MRSAERGTGNEWAVRFSGARFHGARFHGARFRGARFPVSGSWRPLSSGGVGRASVAGRLSPGRDGRRRGVAVASGGVTVTAGRAGGRGPAGRTGGRATGHRLVGSSARRRQTYPPETPACTARSPWRTPTPLRIQCVHE
ncbi:pentapeptide repeat-containing protein [Streptomyces sp. NPDC003077]|uniref:pentapeptide repeat-containing protein n=1 Tax=Streptomyces sp. NPDC003077 TaxID=3154443 RepID=UPI0033AA804B